jgi:hypothetical protein
MIMIYIRSIIAVLIQVLPLLINSFGTVLT